MPLLRNTDTARAAPFVPPSDDDLGAQYLAGREDVELRIAERELDALIPQGPQSRGAPINVGMDTELGEAERELGAIVPRGRGAEGQPDAPGQTQAGPAAPPPELPVDDDTTAWDVVKDYGGSIIKGFAEAPMQVLGGAIDAANETVESFFALGQWLRKEFPALAVGEAEGKHGWVEFEVPEELLPTTEPAKDAGGQLVRKLSQFLVGFVGAGKAMKAIKVGGKLAGLGKAAAQGAIADFAVFDGQEGRLSNLVQEFPALQNPVTEYLASDPNDTQAEGRFKNVLEGLGLGALSEGLALGLRTLRASRAARQTMKADPITGAAVGVAEENAAEALEESVRKFLGNPEGPSYSLSSRDAWVRGSRVFQWEDLGGRSGASIPVVDMPTKNGKAININFAKIDSPDSIKRLMEVVAEENAGLINEARRGVVTQEQTLRLADDLGMTVNDLLSRKVGEAYNAEQLTAARMILISSAEKLHELSNLVKYGGSAIKSETDRLGARIAWQHQFAIHSAVQAQVSGAMAEGGRSLNILKTMAQSTKAHRRLVQEMMGELEKGATTEDLASMVLAFDSPGQVSRFTRDAGRAKASDVLLEVWINALLSGPQTHAVNTLSNSLTALWMVPERWLAAKAGRARAYFGGTQHVMEGEAGAQLFGMVKGMQDGLRLARKTWRTGEPSDLLTKIEVRNYSALSAESLDLSGDLGRAVDYLGKTVRMPTRALQAEDEFFKAVGYRMEINARAYREAVQEGLDGEALARRVNDLIRNPPPDLHLAAVDAARYQTFTNALEGQVTRALSSSRNPALRVVFPFVRTPVNLAKFGLERTPLAPFVGRWRADIAAGGARRDLALARIALGSLVGATVADLTMSGKITGGGPSNPEMRQTWLMKYKPYSIRIGDEWYSYNRLDPLGLTIGLAADAATIIPQVDEMDASTLAQAASIALSKNITSKTYLRGLSEVVHVLTESDRYAGRYVQQLAGTLIPTGVAQANRTYFDPILRDVQSVVDAIKARVPGESTDLPPWRNLWGEPILMEGGLGPDIISPIYTSKVKNDPVTDELLRHQVAIQMPYRSIDGVELMPGEYSRYVELAGNAAKAGDGLGLHDKLARVIQSARYKRATDGPDGSKDLIIREHIQAYRQLARARLLKEYPELAAHIDRARRERAQALRVQ